MSDDDKALRFRPKPCPLCGTTPHHGLTKVKHCQLHGDPYQNFRIWCPHGCCQVECGDEKRARAKWDNRPNENAESLSQHCPNCEAQAAEIERLRDALGIAIVLVAAELPYAPMLQHLRAALTGKAEQ